MLSCGWASQQCVTKGKLNFWVIENILPSLTDKLDCLISYSQQILPFTHQLIIRSSATSQPTNQVDHVQTVSQVTNQPHKSQYTCILSPNKPNRITKPFQDSVDWNEFVYT